MSIFRRVTRDEQIDRWKQAMDVYRSDLGTRQKEEWELMDLYSAFEDCVTAYAKTIIRNSDCPGKPAPMSVPDCAHMVIYEMRDAKGNHFEEFDLLNQHLARLHQPDAHFQERELEIMDKEIESLNVLAYKQKVIFGSTEKEIKAAAKQRFNNRYYNGG